MSCPTVYMASNLKTTKSRLYTFLNSNRAIFHSTDSCYHRLYPCWLCSCRQCLVVWLLYQVQYQAHKIQRIVFQCNSYARIKLKQPTPILKFHFLKSFLLYIGRTQKRLSFLCGRSSNTTHNHFIAGLLSWGFGREKSC